MSRILEAVVKVHVTEEDKKAYQPCLLLYTEGKREEGQLVYDEFVLLESPKEAFEKSKKMWQDTMAIVGSLKEPQ
jgi:hypothetical protein